MARQFKSVDELAKYINQQAKKTLQQKESNVKNIVVSELRESIRENFYAEYDPKEYVRSEDHGGLTDPDNFEVDNTADGIAIYSTRKGKDFDGNVAYVAEIIEGGKSWSIPDIWGYGYEDARPFIGPARENLRKGKMLEKAFRLDLQNDGFDVK